MTTNEVLYMIGEYGFDNFDHWNLKELTEYVMAKYDCSKYVAKKVARYIEDGYPARCEEV